MKKQLVLLAFVISVISCKKENSNNNNNSGTTTPDNYSSMADFYSKNGVPKQSFNVDAMAGGTFTATQGTKVTIPSNAFTTLSGGTVTGNVTIQFKEIY